MLIFKSENVKKKQCVLSPLQPVGDDSKPVLHLQKYDPIVFLHSVYVLLQLSTPVKHSSTSK